MSKTKEQFGVPNPTSYVISCLKTIKTQSITNGCLFHNFQVRIIQLKNKLTFRIILFYKKIGLVIRRRITIFYSSQIYDFFTRNNKFKTKIEYFRIFNIFHLCLKLCKLSIKNH